MTPRSYLYPYQLFLTCLCLSILSGIDAYAQEKRAVFSCITWGDLPYSEVFYRDGENFTQLEFVSGHRSESYPLNAKGVLELYTYEEVDGGEKKMKLIGKTAVSPVSRRTLFMIGKSGAKSKLPLSIRGVDDSFGIFPAGSFRFANFSRSTLKVSFGRVNKTLGPGEIKVYKAKMAPNGGLMSLIVSDNKGKPVFARRLFGQPRDRSMVFIAPSTEKQNMLSIRILPQIVPRENKP